MGNKGGREEGKYGKKELVVANETKSGRRRSGRRKGTWRGK
jgi:hypothetical protein